MSQVFLFVGADPATEWLRDCDVALDAKGFVRTGPDLSRDDLARSGRRTIPGTLETNVPGVFAVATSGAARSSAWEERSARGAAVVAQAELARTSPPLGATPNAS